MFHDPNLMDPVREFLADANPRPKRMRRIMKATARCADGGYVTETLLVNISNDGVCLRFSGGITPTVLSRVDVEISGLGTIPALVRWTDDRRAGLEFETPIDLSGLGEKSDLIAHEVPSYLQAKPTIKQSSTMRKSICA